MGSAYGRRLLRDAGQLRLIAPVDGPAGLRVAGQARVQQGVALAQLEQHEAGQRGQAGKDEIISAVVTDGTAAMGRQLAPIPTSPEPPPLPELMEQLLRTIAEFGRDKQDGIDRLLASIHGWSHSQSDPALKAATRAAYRRQRELFADIVRRWQAAGTFDPGADPDAVAELLQSIALGFVAQRALAGDADVHAHVAALEALTADGRSDVEIDAVRGELVERAAEQGA